MATYTALCRQLNALGLYPQHVAPQPFLWTEGPSTEEALLQCWLYPESSEGCAARLLTCAPVGRNDRQPYGLVYSMSSRPPRLVLPSGQRYTPTLRQWRTTSAIGACTQDGPVPNALLPSDLEPRIYEGAHLRRIWLTLVAKGALERTPQGYRLLPSVSDQILAQYRPAVPPTNNRENIRHPPSSAPPSEAPR